MTNENLCEMIIKEKVLVRDNRGFFLKMFKRKFKKEFEFYEDYLLLKKENQSSGFDYSIFVVYTNTEMADFFELEAPKSNFLICLFNKHLYNSLCRIEEIKYLILMDASKNKKEIFEDLKICFQKTSSTIPQLSKKKLSKIIINIRNIEIL